MVLGQLLGEHLDGRSRLLEIGCGTGGNLSMLADHGDAVGIDAAPLAVRRAREAGYTVELGELPRALPASVGRFDAVCLFDVLEHIADDLTALRAVRPLLRAGGLLFVTVPALSWLWSHHDESFGHHRRYHRPALLRLLADAGFTAIHSSYFCSLLFPAVAALRLAGRVLPPRRQTDFAVPTLGLNRLLHRLFAAEAPLVVRHALPIGSSLLAVARRAP